MADEDYIKEEDIPEEDIEPVKPALEDEDAGQAPAVNEEAEDLNGKYLRLYADFENYRRRVNKDKEDIIRYGNESLLYELLPAIDNLELALKHTSGEVNSGLIQGVEMTLKELQRTLEKFGLSRIDAAGRPFDPAVHHAMSQAERDDMDEKMIAEEFRAGYRYRDKVLRPSLVAVSVKPQKQQNNEADASEPQNQDSTEEEQ